MTDVESVVQVGTAAGQAAIDAAREDPPGLGGQETLVGVLQFLTLQADEMEAGDETDEHLLTAYRRWLAAALAFITAAGPLRDYALAAAALTAEIQLARSAAEVSAPVPSTSQAQPAPAAGNGHS